LVFAVAANDFGLPSEAGATASISPARNASASLFSLLKNLIEMCWILTLPPHQCGFADSSAPLVGTRLSIFQGPVPMTRVPGCPKVCACWNFFSKIRHEYSAAENAQFGSGCISVTCTV
jgi:hypothetical protein